MKTTAQRVRENGKLNLNVSNFLLAGSKVLLKRSLDSWPEHLAQTHDGRGGPDVPVPLPRLQPQAQAGTHSEGGGLVLGALTQLENCCSHPCGHFPSAESGPWGKHGKD